MPGSSRLRSEPVSSACFASRPLLNVSSSAFVISDFPILRLSVMGLRTRSRLLRATCGASGVPFPARERALPSSNEIYKAPLRRIYKAPLRRIYKAPLRRAESAPPSVRDLKPGNIKITPDGVVKVLDFGLAKMGGAPRRTKPEDSPTETLHDTQAGVILGTAAYMAPSRRAANQSTAVPTSGHT
jgi:hypothetical protein